MVIRWKKVNKHIQNIASLISYTLCFAKRKKKHYIYTTKAILPLTLVIKYLIIRLAQDNNIDIPASISTYD